MKPSTFWRGYIGLIVIAIGSCVFSGSAKAQQTQTDDQKQGTTNVTTSGPASVTSAGANDNASSMGNVTNAHQNQNASLQNQAQSQAQSNASSGSYSGASGSSAGSSSTSSSANTSGGSQSNAGNSTGAIDASNRSVSNSKDRAYSLGFSRAPVHTVPMRCTESSAWSFDATIIAGSKSTSKDDPYCIRLNRVAQLCQAAVSYYVLGDFKEYVSARRSAAKLECSDKRISEGFESRADCAQELEVAICPLPLPEPKLVVAPTPKEVVREVVKIERVEGPVVKYLEAQPAAKEKSR